MARLREPKVPRLFRWLFPGWTEEIEDRRVRGLANLAGVVPQGEVTADSEIEFYPARDRPRLSRHPLLTLETKSAIDDRRYKWPGLVIFALLVAGTVLAPSFDEILKGTFAYKGDAYRAATNSTRLAAVAIPFIVYFLLLRSHFHEMDRSWSNNVDSFFGMGAPLRQMEAIRNCMREFKRFLKWRRFMRLTLNVVVLVLFLELAIVGLAIAGTESVRNLFAHVAVSEGERLVVAELLVWQLIWLAAYWMTYSYFTLLRDPTLHLCVLVNVLDRSVPRPGFVERDRSVSD